MSLTLTVLLRKIPRSMSLSNLNSPIKFSVSLTASELCEKYATKVLVVVVCYFTKPQNVRNLWLSWISYYFHLYSHWTNKYKLQKIATLAIEAITCNLNTTARKIEPSFYILFYFTFRFSINKENLQRKNNKTFSFYYTTNPLMSLSFTFLHRILSCTNTGNKTEPFVFYVAELRIKLTPNHSHNVLSNPLCFIIDSIVFFRFFKSNT